MPSDFNLQYLQVFRNTTYTLQINLQFEAVQEIFLGLGNNSQIITKQAQRNSVEKEILISNVFSNSSCQKTPAYMCLLGWIDAWVGKARLLLRCGWALHTSEVIVFLFKDWIGFLGMYGIRQKLLEFFILLRVFHFERVRLSCKCQVNCSASPESLIIRELKCLWKMLWCSNNFTSLSDSCA